MHWDKPQNHKGGAQHKVTIVPSAALVACATGMGEAGLEIALAKRGSNFKLTPLCHEQLFTETADRNKGSLKRAGPESLF